MKTLFKRFQIIILLVEHKWALVTKNFFAQQIAIEKMIMVNTEIRIEKEQYVNKLLFK